METTTPTHQDAELKARHRKMWATGDYPSMGETFLTPLGPRLVEACRLGPGIRVLGLAPGGLGRPGRPGARFGLLAWTPEGMTVRLFRTMGPFAPPPPPGAQRPP